MCGVCLPWRLCVASHVLWSMLYIVVGAIQLIAGIFFLISLPVFKIGSNIWTGVWNVIAGVGGAVFSCVGDVNPNKQQVLLYLTISVLVLNVVNLVVLELGEWRIMMPDAVKVVIEEENLQTLVLYARIMTSISTGVAVITSFVDAQFMFCWLEHNLRPSSSHHRHHNETVSDIEYVIPRVKSSSNESQGEPNQNTPNSNAHVFNQYAQSWVFDTETVGSSQSDSPYSKLQQFNGSKTVILKRKTKRPDCEQISNSITSSSTKSKSQPMVLVEDTTTENERQLQFMTSFSRTPSPVAGGHNSDSSSPTSNPPMIYECLERLTEPSVYRSRLNTTFGMNAERTSPCISPRPHSVVVNDQVQYASLMIELEKTIGAKFPVNKTPSENRSENITRISSRRSSSHDENNSNMYQNSSNLMAPNLQSQNDTDFSKELEAALQLIQDLESPITADTPSDNPLSTFHQQHLPSVNASYTIDDERAKPRCLVSQLTEGSIDRGISSSSNSDGKIQSQFCYLHHTFCNDNCYYLSQQKIPDESDNFNNELENSDYKMLLNDHKMINVVPKSQNNDINTIKKSESLTPPDSETENNSCGITTISSKIANNNNNNSVNNNNADVLSDIDEIPEINFKQPNFQSQNIQNSTSSSLTSSSSSSSMFTRFKSMITSSKNRSSFSSSKYQRKKLQLLPELENAILKSESLVHLSDVELVQRYNRNKYIHRKIEEKALQQINGASNSDTSC